MDAKQSRWSLTSTGNRVMWAVVLGLLTFLALHSTPLMLLVGTFTYVLLTAIVSNRRRGD